MGHVTISRRFDFSASHRYYRDDWSEEENRRVFGLWRAAPTATATTTRWRSPSPVSPTPSPAW